MAGALFSLEQRLTQNVAFEKEVSTKRNAATRKLASRKLAFESFLCVLFFVYPSRDTVEKENGRFAFVIKYLLAVN